MKIKAYQVAPEYQAGYMLEYMCDDTIIITGNKYFIGHETDTYSMVRNALCNGENPCEEDEESFAVWEKLINDSTEQIISDEEAICEGLKLVTGEEWNYRELRGSVRPLISLVFGFGVAYVLYPHNVRLNQNYA